MGEQAALGRRAPVRAGILWFTGICVLLSLSLVVFDGAGNGVGASGAGNAHGNRAAAHTSGTIVSTVQPAGQHAASSTTTTTPAPTTTTTSSTTTTTAPPPQPPPAPPPVATPAATSPPAAAPAASPAASALPARGGATEWGCAAALAYLAAYSAPGFTFQCPGYSLGHEAMTCVDEPGVCAGTELIAITDPCPAAYMNEASNSWVVIGQSDAPIDPYGACP